MLYEETKSQIIKIIEERPISLANLSKITEIPLPTIKSWLYIDKIDPHLSMVCRLLEELGYRLEIVKDENFVGIEEKMETIRTEKLLGF